MFLDLAVTFKQTPSFPLYVGIKWKTRSLPVKCFPGLGGDFYTDSVFSTLWGYKVENTESVVKCFPGHGDDFYVEAKMFF